MKVYLNIILEEADKVHKNSFDTNALCKRFEKLDKDKKIYFNKRIEEEFFRGTLWQNCFIDDVFKKIYNIFNEVDR